MSQATEAGNSQANLNSSGDFATYGKKGRMDGGRFG